MSAKNLQLSSEIDLVRCKVQQILTTFKFQIYFVVGVKHYFLILIEDVFNNAT